jgi:hypothetical protein
VTADGECITREGPVKYAKGDALVCGVAGDRWPVPRERFDTTYDPVTPLERGAPGRYTKRPDQVLARQMDQAFSVDLSGGRGTLSGSAGDWLVQYGSGDAAVVGNEIFAQTYELL